MPWTRIILRIRQFYKELYLKGKLFARGKIVLIAMLVAHQLECFNFWEVYGNLILPPDISSFMDMHVQSRLPSLICHWKLYNLELLWAFSTLAEESLF